jgi:hypothetical protein
MKNILILLIVSLTLSGCLSLKNTKFKLVSYSPGEEFTIYEFKSKNPKQRFEIIDSCDKFTNFKKEYSIKITELP